MTQSWRDRKHFLSAKPLGCSCISIFWVACLPDLKVTHDVNQSLELCQRSTFVEVLLHSAHVTSHHLFLGFQTLTIRQLWALWFLAPSIKQFENNFNTLSQDIPTIFIYPILTPIKALEQTWTQIWTLVTPQ